VIRAVIDTNVLVSALISPRGKEALIPLLIRQGVIRPCLSPEVLAEYVEVLNRPKFGFDRDESAAMLALFQGHGDHVDAAPLEGRSTLDLPDPDDVPFLACALALGASCGRRRYSLPPEDSTRVRHVIEAARAAVGFTIGRSRADLDSDQLGV
jgi:putative PIN family toxin of toxin-antitoxin system